MLEVVLVLIMCRPNSCFATYEVEARRVPVTSEQVVGEVARCEQDRLRYDVAGLDVVDTKCRVVVASPAAPASLQPSRAKTIKFIM